MGSLECAVGQVAKKHFGRQPRDKAHTEIGILTEELKADRGRRAEIRSLVDFLPEGHTAGLANSASFLFCIETESSSTSPFESQLEAGQDYITCPVVAQLLLKSVKPMIVAYLVPAHLYKL